MTTPDYALVCGVDAHHLEQFAHTWPTWKRHKPSLLQRPMLMFADWTQLREADVRRVVDHPDLTVVPWPPDGVTYSGDGKSKWTNPQRAKMLAGFVHVPAWYVHTPYWLKLDTDVVATGQDDWIDPSWFDGEPAVVSHAWSFTKPPDQMVRLDEWAEDERLLVWFHGTEPLDLAPQPGWERLRHQRIISFCAFFQNDFTKLCSVMAEKTCGKGRIPTNSQDGFCWYVATRLGLGVRRVSMKARGWQHWHARKNVVKHSKEAMR